MAHHRFGKHYGSSFSNEIGMFAIKVHRPDSASQSHMAKAQHRDKDEKPPHDDAQ